MPDLGNRFSNDTLLLVKGRDFKCGLENLDAHDQPEEYPEGDLFLEINSRNESNAVQEVKVEGANGGTYKLGFVKPDATVDWSANIDFNDVVDNPQNLSGDITDALVAIPSIGAGNVAVRPSSLVPVWEVDLVLNAGHVLTEQTVNLLNKTMNTMFNAFDGLLGIRVEFVIHDNLNLTMRIISLREFNEVGLITFATDVTGTAVATLFNTIIGLVGLFHTVHVDFYWIHKYIVEFTGDLGIRPIPALAVNTASLTGVNTPSVVVDVIDPGKHPLTLWHFSIDGSMATIKIESEEVNKMADKFFWQLVFLPDGEPAGGDPLGMGEVQIQAKRTWVPE